jgi:AraC family carnitine catabolism transcriptional activator
VFLVAANTNMLTLTSLIDGMRAANRLGDSECFRYSIATTDGQAAVASNGFIVPAQHALSDAPIAPHIFVLASYEPKPQVIRQFLRFVRKAAHRGATLYGIDQGSLILAEAGLLDGHRATTHWEVLPSLQDRHPNVSFAEELFVMDGKRVTCAGHSACLDLIVQIIADHHGPALASSVMQEMIYSRRRNGQERQRTLTGPVDGADSPLGKAVAIMSNHLDAPLPIDRIAKLSRISRRRLESLFDLHMGCSPARHYMGLRLSLARELLLYSSMRMVEISSICGFASQANFARAFAREYGTAPTAYRRNFREMLDRPIPTARQRRPGAAGLQAKRR